MKSNNSRKCQRTFLAKGAAGISNTLTRRGGLRSTIGLAPDPGQRARSEALRVCRSGGIGCSSDAALESGARGLEALALLGASGRSRGGSDLRGGAGHCGAQHGSPEHFLPQCVGGRQGDLPS